MPCAAGSRVLQGMELRTSLKHDDDAGRLFGKLEAAAATGVGAATTPAPATAAASAAPQSKKRLRKSGQVEQGAGMPAAIASGQPAAAGARVTRQAGVAAAADAAARVAAAASSSAMRGASPPPEALYGQGMRGLRCGPDLSLRPRLWQRHHPWFIREALRWGAVAFARRALRRKLEEEGLGSG